LGDLYGRDGFGRYGLWCWIGGGFGVLVTTAATTTPVLVASEEIAQPAESSIGSINVKFQFATIIA
jgi:hypothetical protein